MSDKVQCNIHRITIEPKYECHLCRENREYQDDKEERDRVLGGKSQATMTDNEKKEWQLYPITSPGYTGWFNLIHNSSQYCIGMVPPDKVDLIRNLIERPQANALVISDINKLSNFIREIDGNNNMGAGELAERICAKFGKDNSGITSCSCPICKAQANTSDSKYRGDTRSRS